MSRLLTHASTASRELRRSPLLLVLLVGLPAYVVGFFAMVAPSTEAAVHLPGGRTEPSSLTDAFPAFTTPMVASLVGAIGGLFIVRMSSDADRRLVVAGYPGVAVTASRLVLLGVIVVAATIVSVGVMSVAFIPAHPVWFAVAVLVASGTYGAIGVVVGLVLDRLPGVYLLLFGVMLDLFLFQNPLAEDAPAIALWLPGHRPMRLATEAAFADTVRLGSVGGAVAVLVGAAVVAAAVFWRSATGQGPHRSR